MHLLLDSILPAFLWVLLGAFLWMNIMFAIYRFTDDASWVDFFWSAGIGISALVFALTHSSNAPLVGLSILIMLWSIRLSRYLFLRTLKGPEDARYTAIRDSWKSNLHYKFFAFFHFQGLLIALLSLPLIVLQSITISFSWYHFLLIGLFAFGFIFELIADAQLAKHRTNPAKKGLLCNTGLWKYSRHPNYFGELLIWISWGLYAVLSVQTWWGILALVAPALMMYFILFVTGIPQTEAQGLRSRGEAYKQYQKTTSVLIPWFTK